MRVSEVMSKKVISVNAEESVSKALNLMESSHCKELPVLINNKFAGLISLNSIITYPDYSADLKVKSLMFNSPFLSDSDDLFVAIKLMKEVGISGLPVVMNDLVVGFISDYDIIKSLKSDFKGFSVNDLMHEKSPVLLINDLITKAKRAMYYSRINALPVVDSNSRMIGVLREDDMILLFKPREKMGKSQSGEGASVKFLNLIVKDFMTKDFFVVKVGDALVKVIDLMLKNHASSVIITDDALEPVGYLQRSDLVNYLFNKLMPRGVMLNFSGFKLDLETDMVLTKVVSDHLNTYNYLAKNMKSIDVHIKSLHAGEGTRKFELSLKVYLTSGVMKNVTKVGYALRECLDEALTDLEKLMKKDFGKK